MPHFCKIVSILFILYIRASANNLTCGQSKPDAVHPPCVMRPGYADFGMWPWMVSITHRESPENISPYCAGFLIDNIHVISAAHCFYKQYLGLYVARVGSINQNEGQEYLVTKIDIPEEYTERQFHNDIAIVTLDREVKFPNFNPICLPDYELRNMNFTGKKMIVVGWGANTLRGKANDYLKELRDITVLPDERCNEKFREVLRASFERGFPGGLTSKMICAVAPFNEHQDVCTGDSGAPLMYYHQRKWYVIGLSTFGISCNIPGMPSGFANMSSHLDWITEKTTD